jgi:hypothetical protein
VRRLSASLRIFLSWPRWWPWLAAAGSLHLSQIAVATPWIVRLPALLTILLCLPVKLRTNPFSLSNAEQEILAGPLTEFGGRQLALWELAHGLEWVALTGFVVTLAVPVRSSHLFFDFLGFVLISLALVLAAEPAGRHHGAPQALASHALALAVGVPAGGSGDGRGSLSAAWRLLRCSVFLR